MATSAFTPDEQTAYAADMLSLMRPWGNRALWVEAEHFPTDQYSMTLQVRVHGVSEGLLKSAELGRFDFAAKKQDFELKRGQPVFDLAARKA
jgi:hypothetical protein